jgi:hypothetical protein
MRNLVAIYNKYLEDKYVLNKLYEKLAFEVEERIILQKEIEEDP